MMRWVEADRSFTKGLASIESQSSGLATTRAIASGFICPMRLGTSSPSTMEKYVMATTTMPVDSHPEFCGCTPCFSSQRASGSASTASPTMPFRIAMDVMPICTVERNRVGSVFSSRARAAP